MAPEVTMRYSFCERSNWSTMPRSRLTSMCPPGAIRLVPTLTTTRIVVMGCGPGHFNFFAAAKLRLGEPGDLRGEGQHLYPAVRMAFWQGDKSCQIPSLCLLPTPPAVFPT